MILRLLLALVVVIAVIWGVQHIRRQPKERQRGLWIRFIFVAGAVTLAVLAVTGRLHWVGLALAAILPLFRTAFLMLVRFAPRLLPFVFARHKSSKAQATSTEYIQVVMDNNGEMGGLILKGSKAGKQLQQLSDQELLQIQQEFRSCAASVQVVRAFITKYRPHLHSGDKQQSGAMSESEAKEVLNIKGDYDKAAVISAHRKLMQKFHPDRGGSDYLAAKINQAKDVLLTKFG
jgi:hypothetical protein